MQFNRDTLQPYKSQAYVKFGETIYMDRFMDNADPPKKTHSKAIQSELSSTRERIRLLVEGKASPAFVFSLMIINKIPQPAGWSLYLINRTNK